VVRLGDSHKIYTGANSATLTGLAHLEGKSVVVWADGSYRGSFTVSGGQINVGATVQNAMVGLPYSATYKSAKLVYGGPYGPTLLKRKTFKKLGILARNLHGQSLRYGDANGPMYAMPPVEDGKPVLPGTVWSEYDKDSLPVDNVWTTDSRVRLTAQAPLPATVLALVAPVESNDSV
jgi:hypothetical protein